MFPLILLSGLMAADTLPAAAVFLAPPAPASTAAPPVRPALDTPARIIVHRQPELPLVALRLSILMDDPPGYSGVGHLVQHLQLERMRREASQVGARVQISRGTDAIVYSVVGPAVELDHLARVLRIALVAPRVSAGEFLTAMHELAEERLAEWETAERHVRATLRSQMFPQDLPAAGTEAAAERLTPDLLQELWSYIYRPERISVVAVGNVTPDEVQAVFGGLQPRREVRLSTYTESVPVPPLAPPEATHGWFGAGWLVGDADPVAVAVTGRLLERWLQRRLNAVSVQVEHWWTHEGHALVAVVATTEAERRSARRLMADPLGAMQREIEEQGVRAAATGLRRDMVFYARTPDRFAELLGSFADRGGDIEAQDFYDGLDRVRLGHVLLALAEMRRLDPVRVEVAPQRVRSGQ